MQCPRIPWLCSTALAAWLAAGLAGETQAQERTIPNFTSANFGWLVHTGFDYRPVEGTVAPIGADSNWRGGIGLPISDFNHQPPEAAADTALHGGLGRRPNVFPIPLALLEILLRAAGQEEIYRRLS